MLTRAGLVVKMCGNWQGAFVYQLGHGPLKAERRVRFPYALPPEQLMVVVESWGLMMKTEPVAG
jgi:hypothetical protein